MRVAITTSAVLVVVAIASAGSLSAEEPAVAYDYRERTRQIAFDPGRFFDGGSAQPPYMSIIYSGDDYGYPVYSIAVRKGCTSRDTGDARKTCGKRMVARMVRSPGDGETERPRWRGAKLFAALAKQNPTDDDQLVAALDGYGLEWLEADIGACRSALDHLARKNVSFFNDPAVGELSLVLHADKITFDYRSEYLAHTRYYGQIKPENAGGWAAAFASSLEPCWVPSAAPKPWLEQATGG
ncbi:hypothetical protein WAB17_09850 [Parerythrobacter aurantius]|uniref:hypothetical protein n=1 Tax=Parerythrobacter aurantius TaxID=3127706 RepID=UPI00325537E6